MKRILIRHALADISNVVITDFGKEGTNISKQGEGQIKSLKAQLAARGINATAEPVAVSELLRTRQTAEATGFKNITVNSLLNEVNTSNPDHTLKLIGQTKLPPEAIAAAKAIIANPPKENIWITHGLVIAALLVELGLADFSHFIPTYCEIREIDL